MNELSKKAHADEVCFISLQFTDLVGNVKSVDIPIERLPEALERGVWFDGSSVQGFARISESDMLLVPDYDTFRVMPASDLTVRARPPSLFRACSACFSEKARKGLR